MATIRSAIQIQDGMSPAFKKYVYSYEFSIKYI